MAKPIAIRRAAVYRQRAEELAATAREEQREDVKRHLLDQAATFQRAADAMAPAPEPPVPHLSGPFKGFFDPPRVKPMPRKYEEARSRLLRQSGT